MTCGTCGGSGTVVTDKGAYKCWGCNGSGKVPNSLN